MNRAQRKVLSGALLIPGVIAVLLSALGFARGWRSGKLWHSEYADVIALFLGLLLAGFVFIAAGLYVWAGGKPD